jgi:hypothetical protein
LISWKQFISYSARFALGLRQFAHRKTSQNQHQCLVTVLEFQWESQMDPVPASATDHLLPLHGRLTESGGPQNPSSLAGIEMRASGQTIGDFEISTKQRLGTISFDHRAAMAELVFAQNAVLRRPQGLNMCPAPTALRIRALVVGVSELYSCHPLSHMEFESNCRPQSFG